MTKILRDDAYYETRAEKAAKKGMEYVKGQFRLALYNADYYNSEWTNTCKLVEALRAELTKLMERHDKLKADHNKLDELWRDHLEHAINEDHNLTDAEKEAAQILGIDYAS